LKFIESLDAKYKTGKGKHGQSPITINTSSIGIVETATGMNREQEHEQGRLGYRIVSNFFVTIIVYIKSFSLH